MDKRQKNLETDFPFRLRGWYSAFTFGASPHFLSLEKGLGAQTPHAFLHVGQPIWLFRNEHTHV